MIHIPLKAMLPDFLFRCREHICKNLDLNEIGRLSSQTVKYLSGNPNIRSATFESQALEMRWYESLNRGIPDYGVYSHDHYLAELYACFVVYSRKHLLNIQKEQSYYNKSIVTFMRQNGPIERVLDLGCGIGYTTAGLKLIFKDAEVTGFDLEGTRHLSMAKQLSKEFEFRFTCSLDKIGKADLIFASEYFEHIIDPIPHLEEVVRIASPKFFLIANAFGTRAIGHFTGYKHREQIIPMDLISKMFNNRLKSLGYQKLPTKLWNNRPSFWMKK